MKNVVILGSTGSIGIQTEGIIKRNPCDFKVVGLAARGGNVDMVVKQAADLKPAVIAIFDPDKADQVKSKVGTSVKVLSGMEGILELCQYQRADTILNAMVGMVGLMPTITVLESRKTLLLANKESLVVGGEIVMRLVENGATMLPVDSEHSGLLMCLRGNSLAQVENVAIYASGGPFFGKKREELREVTVEQTLKHPNWAMGKVITTQSATLSNKAREVIEAMWMYHLRRDQVRVLVERSSTFHASVLFQDGTEMAQMAHPNMEIPIQYALYYPQRPKNNTVRPNLSGRKIEFYEPDRNTFKALRLGEEAADAGGTMPAVFNGADEKAVELFLDRKINFLDIADFTDMVMKQHKVMRATLDNVVAADRWARSEVEKMAAERYEV